MGRKYQMHDISNENEHKRSTLSRKEERKGNRKQNKITKAIQYAKSKKTNKICISSNDLKSLKALQNIPNSEQKDQDKNIFLSLKNKILSNKNYNNKYANNNSKKSKGKRKKKKNGQIKDLDLAKVNDEEDVSSFKLSSSTNSRLAKLQEYVNQEAKKITEKPKKEFDLNPKSGTDKLIKDRSKVDQLMQDQENDDIEINRIANHLNLSGRQKKRYPSYFVDDFADILDDIQEGTFDESKYKNDITDYTSDDNFENDVFISLGKMPSQKKIKSNGTVNKETEICTASSDTEISEGESDEDDGTNEFLDDEAEESEIEETDGEPEDKEDELAFESGSCLSSNLTSRISNRPSINTIFDLYSRNTEDDEEDEESESDLDGFIVDDNFVEYTDEDDGDDKSIKKVKKSRIINRERLNSVDSDVIEIDNNNDKKQNEAFLKRRRILSESDCEDAKLSGETSKDKISGTEANNATVKANDIGSKPDDNHKSIILKKNSDTKPPKKKKQKKTNNDDIKPKKRVSFTLPEEENQTLGSELKNEELHEDIYGRLRNKSGDVVNTEDTDVAANGKYIPPAMRKLMALNNNAQKEKQLVQLKKKLKGQLNRLAESNMAGILSQMENYYQFNSRNDMNDTMTKLLFETLVTTAISPEKLVQDHALLVAILSANVGNEVGAHVLTEFVVKWVEDLEAFKPTENGNEVDSKELDNMLMFICQMYNFKVMGASLIYDILQKLLSRNMNSKEVDLILLILRVVGFTLRKDDPLALKCLITEINSKANEGVEKESEETFSRVKFMLDILTAIRNNNMRKVPNYDPSYILHLKQLMIGLVRKGCRASELKISLEDLLKSKVVGKWWIVGSAWSGGLIERNGYQENDVEDEKIIPVTSINNSKYSETFIKKAAKLKISRPPKINIFWAITEGASNYEEAFEKLLEINLSKTQEQEIFNVLIHCCMRCKTYSSLYNNLAIKLIGYKKEFCKLLQFSVWDRFKELDNMKPQHLANLSKFVANLIAEDGLNLSIFKNLDFAQASEKTVSFLRQSLLGIFLHPTGTYAVSSAFEVLCENQNLISLRQYIKLFIVKFIKPHKCEDQAMNKFLKSRVKMAIDKLSSSGGVKL